MATLTDADQALLLQVEKDQIEYIRFERCDLYCRSIGKVLPVKQLMNVLLNGLPVAKPSFGMVINGMGFYINDSYHNTANVSCAVDHSTYRKLPELLCSKAKMARIQYYPRYGLDEISHEKRVFNVDPRALCLQQFEALRRDYGFDILSAFEYEFSMLKKQKTDGDDPDALVPLWTHQNFMDILSFSEHQDFAIDCERCLRAMDVHLETLHLEYGQGCYEWTQTPTRNVATADNAFLFKCVTKELAMRRGWVASFATTPQCDVQSGCSNGAHFNHSLWRDGKNLFYDAHSADNLSLMAKYWIGGILQHIDAITCFAVPTVNCFRRVRAHIFSPGNVSWGFNNRTALIRVKRNGETGTYLEYRLPCSASNAYLVMASVIMAGLDGVRNKTLPCCEPCNDDVYAAQNEGNSRNLPQTLEEALHALLSDALICQQFGAMFVESYVATKRMEIEALKNLSQSLKKTQTDANAAEKRMFCKL